MCISWKPQQSYDNPSGNHVSQNTYLECNHPKSSRQTGTENGHRDRELEGDEQEHNKDHTKPAAVKNYVTGIQSQYQKDFPPPTFCHRRRTPALPQPDNIGINPAFRWGQVCQSVLQLSCRDRLTRIIHVSDTQVWVQHSPKRHLLQLAHHESQQACRHNQTWHLSGSLFTYSTQETSLNHVLLTRQLLHFTSDSYVILLWVLLACIYYL